MEILGYSMEQVYFFVLVLMAAGTFLYLFFGDVTEAIGEGIPFLHPTLVLAFVTLTSATGFFLEWLTDLNSWIILIASLLIAGILDMLIYFFVLIPMASAEVSLAYTDEQLAGQVATVIIPIPADGYGEILIETVNGNLAKRATGLENEDIDYGKTVLVVEVEDGTFYVKEYEPIKI
ncbi:hypothetical protein ACFO0S_07905 [Chryseomicrobium palamuruense]|uniref:Membrane protein NfeD2 N-terminal transmembrane domain-containing protein n=1 Tax=Chryseomicrobium palamuruense TaxID=682973 RepID=A0ABV8UV90_9BACL